MWISVLARLGKGVPIESSFGRCQPCEGKVSFMTGKEDFGNGLSGTTGWRLLSGLLFWDGGAEKNEDCKDDLVVEGAAGGVGG